MFNSIFNVLDHKALALFTFVCVGDLLQGEFPIMLMVTLVEGELITNRPFQFIEFHTNSIDSVTFSLRTNIPHK